MPSLLEIGLEVQKKIKMLKVYDDADADDTDDDADKQWTKHNEQFLRMFTKIRLIVPFRMHPISNFEHVKYLEINFVEYVCFSASQEIPTNVKKHKTHR